MLKSWDVVFSRTPYRHCQPASRRTAIGQVWLWSGGFSVDDIGWQLSRNWRHSVYKWTT